MLVSIGELAEHLGVATGTLRRWDRDGRLTPDSRTAGGHRRYSVERVMAVLGGEEPPCSAGHKLRVAYSRVSSSDQKGDLIRQEERLRQVLGGGDEVVFISDLGSGLNFKKRGLAKLLRLILSGRVAELVVTHKDRLLRFGYELVESMVKAHGGCITILEKQTETTEDELTADVLSVITVFSSKLYGRRSHRNRRARLTTTAPCQDMVG